MAASLIPSSWVLADLFEVTALELLTPDHVLELEAAPELAYVPCSACDGLGWLESYGSAWGASCDAWGRPDLNFTLKPCTRCHCEGEVLDFPYFKRAPVVLSQVPLKLYLETARGKGRWKGQERSSRMSTR